MNILITDDAQETREAIKNIINVSIDSSIRVFEASNGEEALDILKSNSIDVLLTDILMPVIDGFELIKRVKSDITEPNTFIVAITGLGADEQIQKLFESGIDYYIQKPIQQEDLIARLKLVIKLVSREKDFPAIVRDTFNPFKIADMMNYYTIFVILQEDDLYKILHHIVTFYPQANKMMLKDFMTVLLKSYESLTSKFPSPFEIKLEPSSTDLFISCSDFSFIEAVKQHETNMPPGYATIYMPHSSMTVKIPAKG